MPGLIKKEVNYFDKFVEGAEFCREAAVKVHCMLRDNSISKEEREFVHGIEHAADRHVHEMFEHLNHSFLTPIDRDDIIEIVKETDNVVDGIDAVASEFWLLHINKLIPEAEKMAGLIVRSCQSMVEMMQELKHYKKNSKLMERIIEINCIEEEGDRIYQETVHKLFAPGADALFAVKWRSVIDLMENVLDACENVADTVQSVITKAS